MDQLRHVCTALDLTAPQVDTADLGVCCAGGKPAPDLARFVVTVSVGPFGQLKEGVQAQGEGPSADIATERAAELACQLIGNEPEVAAVLPVASARHLVKPTLDTGPSAGAKHHHIPVHLLDVIGQVLAGRLDAWLDSELSAVVESEQSTAWLPLGIITHANAVQQWSKDHFDPGSLHDKPSLVTKLRDHLLQEQAQHVRDQQHRGLAVRADGLAVRVASMLQRPLDAAAVTSGHRAAAGAADDIESESMVEGQAPYVPTKPVLPPAVALPNPAVHLPLSPAEARAITRKRQAGRDADADALLSRVLATHKVVDETAVPLAAPPGPASVVTPTPSSHQPSSSIDGSEPAVSGGGSCFGAWGSAAMPFTQLPRSAVAHANSYAPQSASHATVQRHIDVPAVLVPADSREPVRELILPLASQPVLTAVLQCLPAGPSGSSDSDARAQLVMWGKVGVPTHHAAVPDAPNSPATPTPTAYGFLQGTTGDSTAPSGPPPPSSLLASTAPAAEKQGSTAGPPPGGPPPALPPHGRLVKRARVDEPHPGRIVDSTGASTAPQQPPTSVMMSPPAAAPDKPLVHEPPAQSAARVAACAKQLPPVPLVPLPLYTYNELSRMTAAGGAQGAGATVAQPPGHHPPPHSTTAAPTGAARGATTELQRLKSSDMNSTLTIMAHRGPTAMDWDPDGGEVRGPSRPMPIAGGSPPALGSPEHPAPAAAPAARGSSDGPPGLVTPVCVASEGQHAGNVVQVPQPSMYTLLPPGLPSAPDGAAALDLLRSQPLNTRASWLAGAPVRGDALLLVHHAWDEDGEVCAQFLPFTVPDWWRCAAALLPSKQFAKERHMPLLARLPSRYVSHDTWSGPHPCQLLQRHCARLDPVFAALPPTPPPLPPQPAPDWQGEDDGRLFNGRAASTGEAAARVWPQYDVCLVDAERPELCRVRATAQGLDGALHHAVSGVVSVQGRACVARAKQQAALALLHLLERTASTTLLPAALQPEAALVCGGSAAEDAEAQRMAIAKQPGFGRIDDAPVSGGVAADETGYVGRGHLGSGRAGGAAQGADAAGAEPADQGAPATGTSSERSSGGAAAQPATMRQLLEGKHGASGRPRVAKVAYRVYLEDPSSPTPSPCPLTAPPTAGGTDVIGRREGQLRGGAGRGAARAHTVLEQQTANLPLGCHAMAGPLEDVLTRLEPGHTATAQRTTLPMDGPDPLRLHPTLSALLDVTLLALTDAVPHARAPASALLPSAPSPSLVAPAAPRARTAALSTIGVSAARREGGGAGGDGDRTATSTAEAVESAGPTALQLALCTHDLFGGTESLATMRAEAVLHVLRHPVVPHAAAIPPRPPGEQGDERRRVEAEGSAAEPGTHIRVRSIVDVAPRGAALWPASSFLRHVCTYLPSIAVVGPPLRHVTCLCEGADVAQAVAGSVSGYLQLDTGGDEGGGGGGGAHTAGRTAHEGEQQAHEAAVGHMAGGDTQMEVVGRERSEDVQPGARDAAAVGQPQGHTRGGVGGSNRPQSTHAVFEPAAGAPPHKRPRKQPGASQQIPVPSTEPDEPAALLGADTALPTQHGIAPAPVVIVRVAPHDTGVEDPAAAALPFTMPGIAFAGGGGASHAPHPHVSAATRSTADELVSAQMVTLNEGLGGADGQGLAAGLAAPAEGATERASEGMQVDDLITPTAAAYVRGEVGHVTPPAALPPNEVVADVAPPDAPYRPTAMHADSAAALLMGVPPPAGAQVGGATGGGELSDRNAPTGPSPTPVPGSADRRVKREGGGKVLGAVHHPTSPRDVHTGVPSPGEPSPVPVPEPAGQGNRGGVAGGEAAAGGHGDSGVKEVSEERERAREVLSPGARDEQDGHGLPPPLALRLSVWSGRLARDGGATSANPAPTWPPHVVGCGAVTLVDCLQEWEPAHAERVLHHVLAGIRPQLAVVTTPCADYNPVMRAAMALQWLESQAPSTGCTPRDVIPSSSSSADSPADPEPPCVTRQALAAVAACWPGRVGSDGLPTRHVHSRCEWSAQEFRDLTLRLAAQHGYVVRHQMLGHVVREAEAIAALAALPHPRQGLAGATPGLAGAGGASGEDVSGVTAAGAGPQHSTVTPEDLAAARTSPTDGPTAGSYQAATQIAVFLRDHAGSQPAGVSQPAAATLGETWVCEVPPMRVKAVRPG